LTIRRIAGGFLIRKEAPTSVALAALAGSRENTELAQFAKILFLLKNLGTRQFVAPSRRKSNAHFYPREPVQLSHNVSSRRQIEQ
jgi:hypothetical protein